MFGVIVPRTLGWQDYVVLAIYLAVNLLIGWYCSRKKQIANGFFLGDGKVVWWAAAISFFATGTSSISFMALPAKTYQSDWLSVGSVPAQAVAGIVVGFVFVAILRRLNLVTIFGYLDQRFDRRVRLLAAGMGVLLKIGGRMSVVMLLPSLALSTVTGMNVYLSIVLMGVVTTIYAMEGGFEAVIWTDVMQVAVMVGGVTVALFYLSAGVSNGLAGIVHVATASGKFKAISWSTDLSEPTVWVFAGMFFATIFGQVADQPLMQRMLSTANERDARQTVIIGNIIGMIGGLIFFFVGTALWVFYRTHPDRLAVALPNDAIFPYFIANELPLGVVGLIVAALFASAMGALSSAINATAAIIVSDFQQTLQPEATEAQRLTLAKISTVVCGVLATAMAAFLAWRNVASLWEEFLRLVALLGGSFPGVFALGLLTRKASSSGVIVGLVLGTVATWAIQHFTHASIFLHGFVALIVCMATGYVASLLLPERRPRMNSNTLTLWDLYGSKRAVK